MKSTKFGHDMNTLLPSLSVCFLFYVSSPCPHSLSLLQFSPLSLLQFSPLSLFTSFTLCLKNLAASRIDIFEKGKV